ncbi:MAG: glycosyltransferase family 2 protein [Nitratireductor sp.]|nr:glycosyltransferase family 2 protein [Nitratireductor sp.]
MSHAVRQVDIAVGSKNFHLYQLPFGFETTLDPEQITGFLQFLDSADLDQADRMRLLVQLFGTIARLLLLHRDPVFADVVRSLACDESLPQASVGLELIQGCDTALVTVPARAGFLTDDVFVSLSRESLAIGSLNKVAGFLACDNPDAKLATLVFSGAPVEGEGLLIGARGLVRMDIRIRRHDDIRAFYEASVSESPDMTALLGQADDDAAPVIGRLARHAPARPVIEDYLLGFRFSLDIAIGLPAGLFVGGWFYDPESRIENVVAIDHSLDESEVPQVWHVTEGHDEIFGRIRSGKRFFAFLPRAEDTLLPDPVAVRVALDNGENHIVTAEPVPQDMESRREHILDSLTGRLLSAETLEKVFRPALAPIQDELNARQSIHEVKEFGSRSERSVSIIIPLYKETRFIRSQLMAFAVDPFVKANCEVVYVVDDPPISARVAAFIEGASQNFPLDIKLVTLTRNGGYALANNMGVGCAEGRILVLMNSDVVPGKGGWLEPALSCLSGLPAFSVIGPKLLYADGSLQHAGMYFGRLGTGFWQNFHYWKGYARHFAPALLEREVPAVTGACMILPRSDYLAVGGFTTDYIIGDYEDSDLCLKLREKGGVPIYMPSVELYHFERQSMAGESDSLDRGSTIHNRALHTARWENHISTLMMSVQRAADVR